MRPTAPTAPTAFSRTAAASGGAVRGPAPAPGEEALRRRYEAYRRRQGTALLSLVPREGVRPLYRAAREAARETAGGAEADGEGLALLAGYCRDLLPLPPYEVWRADFLRHTAAHLDEAADWPEASSSSESAPPVESRTIEAGGLSWRASLEVRRGEGAWWGHLTFHRDGALRPFRTGEIFREPSASAVRSQFLSFDDATLGAFLRSVLP